MNIERVRSFYYQSPGPALHDPHGVEGESYLRQAPRNDGD